MTLERLKLSDEEIQDLVASLITGQNDASVIYDDQNDQLAVDVSTVDSADITVTDTQTGTVADGEFLTNQGGSLTGGTVQTEPNIPTWEEDPNSPLTVTNSDTGSITLSETYKAVKLIGVANGVGATINVFVDNEAFGYDISRYDGTTTFSEDEISDVGSSSIATGHQMTFTGIFDNSFSMNNQSVGGDAAPGEVLSASSTSRTSPLNSIQLKLSASESGLKYRVYGLK